MVGGLGGVWFVDGDPEKTLIVNVKRDGGRHLRNERLRIAGTANCTRPRATDGIVSTLGIFLCFRCVLWIYIMGEKADKNKGLIVNSGWYG